MHFLRLFSVYGGLGARQQRKGFRGKASGGFVHAVFRDKFCDVGQSAVRVLARERYFRMPAADMVHLPARQAQASGQFRHDRGKKPFRVLRGAFRHAEHSGQKDVTRQTGMRPDRQHRLRRSLRMFAHAGRGVFVRMVSVRVSVFIHQKFLCGLRPPPSWGKEELTRRRSR